MVLEVLQAAAAGCFALLLPGYLWASVLLRTAGRVERLVVGLALSMTLVPVFALGVGSLLDSGITWAVASSAVALMYLGAVPLTLLDTGRLHEPEKRVVAVPRLHLSTLLLVGAALALLLAAALQRLPRERLLVPMLVLLIGVVLTQLLVSSRDDSDSEVASLDASPGVLHHALLAAVLVLTLVRGYIGPVRHDWPYLRGVDHYAHSVLVELRISNGPSSEFLIYPPGFHTLSAVLSQHSGLAPLELYSALAPAVLVMPALAAYTFGLRLYGATHGLLAAVLAGLLLPSSYIYFNDAMYPNLLAAQFFLVLALAYLSDVPWSASLRHMVLAALLGASAVLYHMVASVYLAVLLALLALFYLPTLALRNRRGAARLLGTLMLITVLVLAYSWDTYDVPRTVGSLLGAGEPSDATGAVSMAVGTQPPRDIRTLSDSLSRPVQWLSALGAVVLVLAVGRMRGRARLGTLLLLVWAALLFAGSRTDLSGFPHRYERDLGAPLVLMAAWVLAAVVRSALRLRLVAVVCALLMLALLGVEARQRLIAAGRPSSQVVLNAEIQSAGQWLRAHRTDGQIIVSPHVNQVPSRMMLALSGYSGLQSFAPWQLKLRRDLPPTGPEPLQDILRLMSNPKDSAARSILEKYDVRHVVLYKKFNRGTMWTTDMRWDVGAHRARTDLYSVAFENDSVLILQVKNAGRRS